MMVATSLVMVRTSLVMVGTSLVMVGTSLVMVATLVMVEKLVEKNWWENGWKKSVTDLPTDLHLKIK